MRGAKGPHLNRASPEVEAAIVEHCLHNPTHGCLPVSQELMLRGISVSSTGVRGVWIRHGLLGKQERLLRLEATVRETAIELSDEQVKLLERFSPEFRERHIETSCSGELVAVDTFLVGTLKGVGRVYMQSPLDCHSRYPFGHLYTSKLPLTAVQLLTNNVLPFFEQQGVTVRTVLSDNGLEFCGRPDKHPYELFLQLEGIEHRTTRVRRPQNNGYVGRLHRPLLDEHFRILGRTKFYESMEEMQADLDCYLQRYNHERPHQGLLMQGRTLWQAFQDGNPVPPAQEDASTAPAAKPTAKRSSGQKWVAGKLKSA